MSSCTLKELKDSIDTLSARDFYLKHIVRSDNWYFENILNIPQKDILHTIDDFKGIVSESLNISFNSIMMVGSSKIGYSLSPRKNFKKFETNTESENKSDIDIAIISSNLFEQFWKLFRQAYNVKNKRYYRDIELGIYRGFINDKYLNIIDDCYKDWHGLSIKCSKQLKSNLYFQHEISYRIYRYWEDFEEYNLSSIMKIKNGGTENGKKI